MTAPTPDGAEAGPDARTSVPEVGEPLTTLRPHDDGAEVRDIQGRLVALGYWLGTPDGTYGPLTVQAVVAFQKAEGLPRDGVAGPRTRRRLKTATRPKPADDHGDGIEIDLGRQLLFVVRKGGVAWTLDTSTGAPATPTPMGHFQIERGVDGVDHGPLGDLYRPKYFHAGVAIHGFDRIPVFAASHGCTRVSDAAMDMLWASDSAPIGAPVWVHR